MQTESEQPQLSPIWVRLKLLIENNAKNGEVSMSANGFEIDYHFPDVRKMFTLGIGKKE